MPKHKELSPRAQKKAERRAERREKWESFFSPWALAAAGAAISASFLFQKYLGFKIILFALILLAAWASGKKISLLATLFVSLGIVLANLLVPVGQVIGQLGPFRITLTALIDGISKALVFEGLVYVSKASILPGLKLPGRFGGLVASAFVYYDRIVEYKGSIKAATLIDDVDRLMLELWSQVSAEGGEASTAPEARPRMRALPTTALIGAVVLAYLPYILGPLY
jgi:hypothetical protein